MKKIAFLLCFISLSVKAQQNYCGGKIVNNSYHSAAIEFLSKINSSQATLYVPVVFHIVYNNAFENIPDSLIYKQLDQLNRDFKRQNLDTGNTPLPFKAIAGFMDIQFCMASTTPSNTPTNGIDRVFTAKTFFNAPPNYVTLDSLKHANLGGADAWDCSKYLNIWTGNLLNVSGYAAPPTNMMASEDGVGVNYKTLGTTNSSLPYNQRRTVVHEVGHFFGLRHIWGDDGGTCSGTDYMADTPNQANYTPGSLSNTCNAFPLLDACTNTGNGVMFMNYMDYSNDNCRNMFSNAQCNYMLATVNCCRTNLLNNTVTDCNIVTDLKKNQPEIHFMIYPSPAKEKMSVSCEFKIDHVLVLDLSGRTVLEERTSECNISNLSPGTYIVQVNHLYKKLFVKE